MSTVRVNLDPMTDGASVGWLVSYGDRPCGFITQMATSESWTSWSGSPDSRMALGTHRGRRSAIVRVLSWAKVLTADGSAVA